MIDKLVEFDREEFRKAELVIIKDCQPNGKLLHCCNKPGGEQMVPTSNCLLDECVEPDSVEDEGLNDSPEWERARSRFVVDWFGTKLASVKPLKHDVRVAQSVSISGLTPNRREYIVFEISNQKEKKEILILNNILIVMKLTI